MNIKALAIKYSPAVLSVVSVVGLVATVASAIKATPKAVQIINEEGVSEPIDILKATWKCYLPTAILGAGTIACIAGSQFLNTKSQANLAGALALADHVRRQRLDILSHPVTYVSSESEKDEPGILRSHADICTNDFNRPDKKFKWYDSFSDRTFEKYEREVMDAEYHLNRNFMLAGHVSLADFYDLLGLDWDPRAEDIGWSISDGYYWLDFEHNYHGTDNNGEDIYTIDSIFPPDEYYLEDWPHYDIQDPTTSA